MSFARKGVDVGDWISFYSADDLDLRIGRVVRTAILMEGGKVLWTTAGVTVEEDVVELREPQPWTMGEGE